MPQNFDATIIVRVPSEMKERLQKLARDKMVDDADVFRWALKAYADEQAKEVAEV